MAESSSEWSEETYRLDEVGHKFTLPQVIQVTEGIYTPKEVDSFSAGDILKIDQCVQLQKVVAQVSRTPKKAPGRDTVYDFLKAEKLIPLNYKGKLKVLSDKKKYANVRELATDLPPYAQFLQALTVSVEDGKFLKIAAGTKVELDKVRLGPDRLIMRINDGGRRQVEVLLNKRCQFRSAQDETEYTLTEMIERYQLPQTIQFLDSRVEQSDTQDPLEELGQTVTVPVSPLRINKIISQTVLIGHYTEPDTQKRTIVVIPLDSPETREIPVKVYEGEEDYPDVGQLLLEKLGTALTKGPYNCSKVTRVSEDILDAVNKDSKTKDSQFAAPPPVPRRPGQRDSDKPPVVSPRARKVEENAPPVPPRPNTMEETGYLDMEGRKDDEDYIEVKALGIAPPPPQTALPQRSPTSPKSGTYPLFRGKEEKPKGKTVWGRISAPFKKPVSFTTLSTPKTEVPSVTNSAKDNGGSAEEKYEDHTDKSHYDEIDDSDLDQGIPIQTKQIKRPVAQISPQISTVKYPDEAHPAHRKEPNQANPLVTHEGKISAAQKRKILEKVQARPHATHEAKPPTLNKTKPLSTHRKNPLATYKEKPLVTHTEAHQAKVLSEKSLKQLSIEELQETLIKNGLDKFAKFCFDECIDGPFLYENYEEMFKSLKLSPSDEFKLRKIIQSHPKETRL